MKKSEDYDCAVIVDDSEEEIESENEEIIIVPKKNKKQKKQEETINENENYIPIEKTPKKRIIKKQETLKKFLIDDLDIYEIGVDEVGRGPMFGRVYTAAVILPKDDSFDHSKMKDSKKFHSKKKIDEVAEYIKNNAVAWSVSYEDETLIDDINILQATQKCMHKSILETIKKFEKNIDTEKNKINVSNYHLLVDGNYFNNLTIFNKKKNMIENFKYTCIEGGDNKYSAIAAASILAKVSRDAYIDELCQENPYLVDKYGIDSNKGYGAKKHLDGIRQHGITEWHRKTFGICKEYANEN